MGAASGVQILDAGTLDLAAWVRDGDHIVAGQSSGEPQTLTEALVAQAGRIGRLDVFLGANFSGIFGPTAAPSLGFTSFGGLTRNAGLSKSGRLKVVPVHYSHMPWLMASGTYPADVVLVQLSAPRGGRGYTLSTVNDGYLVAAARRARCVIAEVNQLAPVTTGTDWPADIPLHAIVPTRRTLVELPPAQGGETEQRIAAQVASLVRDGDTIQPGLGALADTILAALKQHRHLGLHAGMMTEAALPLLESGVIDNSRKTRFPGVSVTGMAAGTQRLYRHLDGNAAIRLAPATETHSIAVLAAIDNFVSINSAFEVDLHGQVNAEVAHGHYLGGFGGQADFVRGAAASNGGRAIIALASTTRDGKASRIAASLSGPVTTSAADVDHVVTEWGIAQLKGVDFATRKQRLIAIAHPDFRAALAAR